MSDLKFALRSFTKAPGFTLLAVAIMALGIGANTAVFTVLNTVLLKPLPYKDPDRIVTLLSSNRKTGLPSLVSAPNFHDWHDQSNTFDAMAYLGGVTASVIAGDAEAEFVSIAVVTPEFFRVFGVEPIFGRLFTPEECRLGGPSAVVVSYAFWQSHFGSTSEAARQRTIRMNDRSIPIVGVLPPGFHSEAYFGKTDVWILANTFGVGQNRSANTFVVVGRLKPSVSLEQAQAQMTTIGERLERQYPESNRDRGVTVTPMREQRVGGVKPTLYLLLGGVAVLLIIACANMANLLLAKAAERTHEIAIRAALGATRGRILRQLLTESALLSLLSGAAGLGLALWGTRAMLALAPPNIPRLTETVMDGSVLAFTLAVSVFASILFGIVPALVGSRVDLNSALKQSGSHGAIRGVGRMRRALVVSEIALSVVLLTGAGLLTKSLVALNHVALGFRPENLLVMDIDTQARDFEAARRIVRFHQALFAELAALPGISALGSLKRPPGKPFLWADYWIDRLPTPGEGNASPPQALLSPVAPGTFKTLGIPLLRGRDFDDRDIYETTFVTVINETLARKSFPGQDPIGRVLFGALEPKRSMKIVGIVGDVRQWVDKEPWPEIYMPYPQHPHWGTQFSVVVRTAGDPGRIAQAMRRKVHERAPDVPVRFTTAEESLRENLASPRFLTALLAAFAGLAVCLAMAGVYGVIAYIVGQRVSEIGLRMALGASRTDVLWLVLREGLIVAAVGLAIGLATSAAATRLLATMLFDVKPNDPLTYAVVALAIGVASLAASYVPALGATKVDPLIALRQE